jgi:hypothetical protein
MVARLMLWIYRRNLPWRQIPYALLLLGVLMGGVAAALLQVA